MKIFETVVGSIVLLVFLTEYSTGKSTVTSCNMSAIVSPCGMEVCLEDQIGIQAIRNITLHLEQATNDSKDLRHKMKDLSPGSSLHLLCAAGLDLPNHAPLPGFPDIENNWSAILDGHFHITDHLAKDYLKLAKTYIFIEQAVKDENELSSEIESFGTHRIKSILCFLRQLVDRSTMYPGCDAMPDKIRHLPNQAMIGQRDFLIINYTYLLLNEMLMKYRGIEAMYESVIAHDVMYLNRDYKEDC